MCLSTYTNLCRVACHKMQFISQQKWFLFWFGNCWEGRVVTIAKENVNKKENGLESTNRQRKQTNKQTKKTRTMIFSKEVDDKKVFFVVSRTEM